MGFWRGCGEGCGEGCGQGGCGGAERSGMLALRSAPDRRHCVEMAGFPHSIINRLIASMRLRLKRVITVPLIKQQDGTWRVGVSKCVASRETGGAEGEEEERRSEKGWRRQGSTTYQSL